MATVSQVIVSIGAFFAPFAPTGCKIIRGQANQTPPPKAPFIVLTPIGMPQYTTTRTKYIDSNAPGIDGEVLYNQPTKLNVQIDFYGIDGGELANKAATLFRSGATTGKFPDGVYPLFCTDAVQAPLTNAEKQYEDRWTLTLVLQYNNPVAIKMPSFNAVGEVMPPTPLM